LELDVAQAFVFGGKWSVGGPGGGRKPALVDTAAMAAENVQVARIEFQASAGHQKRSRHPTGGEPDEAFAGGEGIANQSGMHCRKCGFLDLRNHMRLGLASFCSVLAWSG